tara:strand:- start:544 stop:960 length:417 start_codon:yes stop_codon:yes gene_type:complete
LFSPELTLTRTVGQIQTNSDGDWFHVASNLNNTLNLVMDFTGMGTDRNWAGQVEAALRFDENNRFCGWLVAQFKGVLCKGPNGAPHCHDALKTARFMNRAPAKYDSLLATVSSHGERMEHAKKTARSEKKHRSAAETA